MCPLRELQENLQAHLLTYNQQIVQCIETPVRGTIADRLEIYSNAYRYRLLEALATEYALLQRFLGENKFEKLGLAYIQAMPSCYFSIDRFGEHLRDFLTNTQAYANKPYLAELADFIWFLNNTLLAADSEVLTVEKMRSIPQEQWPQLRFKLHPSLVIRRYQWNILELWQTLTANRQTAVAKRLSTTVHCVLWRQQLKPYYTSLTPQALWVLQAFQAEQDFSEVCVGLTQWLAEEEVANYVVNLLTRWITDGMLSEVKI